MQPNICTVQKVKDDMAQPQPAKGEAPARKAQPRGNDLPPEILEIIGPALQIGGACGMPFQYVSLFAGDQDQILSSAYLTVEILHVIAPPQELEADSHSKVFLEY